MSVVIIDVGMHNEEGQDKVSLRIEEPPELADLASSNLDLSGDDPVFAAFEGLVGDHPVKGAGELIFQCITQNDAVSQALQQVAQVAPDEALRVLIRISPGNPADELPWEALYLPGTGRFVGLDARWPMARVAGHAGSESQWVPLSGPIKIMAILAAAEREALPEWQAIYDAATNSGLDFRLSVLCSEQVVKNAVEHTGDNRVNVAFVPNDADTLIRDVGRKQPHLLHVFSHATAKGGFLEIATPQAVGLGADALLYVDAELLAAASVKTWLTLLNACEGAQPTASGRSFAYAITSNGTPATIGMRREIDATGAHKFAGAFYSTALDHVKRLIAQDHAQELRWDDVVRMARIKMLPKGPKNRVACDSNEWTLPVLYLRPGSYHLWKMTLAPDLNLEKAREISAELRKLESTKIPDDANPEFRQVVAERIAELRNQLGG